MLFERSKPQLQRKMASKAREQLETDASQKEERTWSLAPYALLAAPKRGACCAGKAVGASQQNEQGEG